MNNKGFQGFGTNPPSQTQLYPDGTIRIIQNTVANPMTQDTKWIATTAMIQQPQQPQQPQEQHPHQHPQIVQSNEISSQTIYYSQGQGQGQGQPIIVKQSSLSGNTVNTTTPTIPYNSSVYTAQAQAQVQAQVQAQAQTQAQAQAQAQTQLQLQGQVQGQTQVIPLYSTSQMNIQMANTPPNAPINTLSGSNIINDISTTYTVAQETKNYTNPIFVLPSPSTPTPQINYTTSNTATVTPTSPTTTTTNNNNNINSSPTLIQIQQQTPPQTTLQQSTNGSNYITVQKANGLTSTQQVILQAPPTPYSNSPTTAQVQVLTQNGNNSVLSPTQIQYQYSVTPPLSSEKEIKIKQENKISPEMTILGVDKIENGHIIKQENINNSNSNSNNNTSSGDIGSSPTTSKTIYSVETSNSLSQTQEKENTNTTLTKENLSPAGEDKGKLEHQSSISQTHGNIISSSIITSSTSIPSSSTILTTSNTSNKMEIITGSTVKEEQLNLNSMNTSSSLNPNSGIKETGNIMNIDSIDTKINNINGLAVIATTNATAMMTQGMIQNTTPTANTTQNINMIQGVQGGVGVNLRMNITSPVNGINVLNGMNNVNYISNVNVNPINTVSTMNGTTSVNNVVPMNSMNTVNTMNGLNGTGGNVNVNVNGISSVNGVQIATAIPQPVQSMNNINMISNNGGNIISISPTSSTLPINANQSINLYYNQGQNIMNTTPSNVATTTLNYSNSNRMKVNVNKGSNGYPRTKNSHIVDPDVPLEVLIKRRKNSKLFYFIFFFFLLFLKKLNFYL